MPEEKIDKQDRMIELLEEMLRWMKVTNIPQVKKLLLDILPSDKERIAYHYSDGRDSREVGTVAGVHFSTVARWWRTWVKVGIAESLSTKGGGERAKRIFSLEDFGIEVPFHKKVESLKKEIGVPIHEVQIKKPSEVDATADSATGSAKMEEST